MEKVPVSSFNYIKSLESGETYQAPSGRLAFFEPATGEDLYLLDLRGILTRR